MTWRGLKDGIKTGNLIVEDFSGNAMAIGRTISQSNLTQLFQSGTYTTNGNSTPFINFGTVFSNTPKVMLNPSEAYGGTVYSATINIALGSFAVSGTLPHTGNYFAYGLA